MNETTILRRESATPSSAGLASRLKFILKDMLFPGLDLHTRNRCSLANRWRVGDRDVLDAGSGNGNFSYLAYQSGARVVAMNILEDQIARAHEFFIAYKGCDPQRLKFEHASLYDLAKDTRTFDEIICFEVLEHIKDDLAVAKAFFHVMKPGGVLHLCCPYRLHPRHQREVLDEAEAGGHVREGYTEEDYRALLEPLGFRIDEVIGIGPPSVYYADELLRTIRHAVGDWAALPIFPLVLPTVWMARMNPRMPFSLYVRCVKVPQDVVA